MEEYLQYMKTLRTQISDVEDQAAKISVEEQIHITTIHALEKDLNSVISETRQIKEDADQMVKTNNHICSQIIEKQKRILSLESDSSTLAQTLELIQQERNSLSAKLSEKSSYYTKVGQDMNAKLQEQQDWLNSLKLRKEVLLVADANYVLTSESKEKSSNTDNQTAYGLGDANKEYLIRKLDAAKAKLDKITLAKNNMAFENSEMKQSIERLKCQINGLKPELRAMDIVSLEEEHKVLSSEKDGEREYLRTIQNKIDKLKGVSYTAKCPCGREYKVEMNLHV